VDQRSDAALILASRDDPAAFVELYRRHAEDLLRYFARRTLDPEAAAELTAETFAEAFASRHTFTDRGMDGVAWVYGIARHQLEQSAPIGENRTNEGIQNPSRSRALDRGDPGVLRHPRHDHHRARLPASARRARGVEAGGVTLVRRRGRVTS